MRLRAFIHILTGCAVLGIPLVSSAAPYYLVSTSIQGANTKIDVNATTTWTFTVSQNFDLGGGALVMKDGAQTSEHLYLTLFDYTQPSLTPTSPGPLGATTCTASIETATQECMTNAQFHNEVDTSGPGANNDQSYVAHYLFFGATSYSATNVVSPTTPFSLLAGHTYALLLTSPEPTNSAYFIKGSPATSTWNFTTDPTCADSTCSPGSLLPPDFISGPIGSESSTPEPGTWFAMSTGLAVLAAVRRRARQSAR